MEENASVVDLRHRALAMGPARAIRWEMALALLVPLATVVSGLYQLYPPIGWVDPGLYIYNFLNLPHIVQLSQAGGGGLDYHSTRLPFVIVGFLVYRVFPMLHAQEIFVVLFYMLGVAGLVAVARTLVSSWTARLALVWVIALNPVWIACFLEGHVDGPAMAFALLSFAALTARRPRLLGLPRECWAGAAVALALSTQPLPGGIAGFVLLTVAIIGEPTWRATIAFVGWAALGGLCTLLALASVGTLFGLPFLYLLTSDDWVGRFLAGATRDTFIVPAEWLPSATRVALWPLALVLLALGAKWGRPGRVSRPVALIMAITAWTILFVVINLLATGFFTQFRFYAGYIFLTIIPALALVLERYDPTRRGASDGWMALAAILLGIGAPVAIGLLTTIRAEDTPYLLVIWGMLTLLALASVYCYRRNKGGLGFVAIALLLTLAAVANTDTAGIAGASPGPSRRAGFAVIAEVHKAVAETGSADRRLLFWFNREDFSEAGTPEQKATYRFSFAGQTYRLNLLDSIGATFGWDRAALSFDMPRLDEAAYQPLTDPHGGPTSIILLCARSSDCQDGARVLAARGMTLRQKLTRLIAVAGVPSFTMVIADVEFDLRGKFPCSAESERAGYLFDHIGVLQTQQNSAALHSFLERHIAAPSECLGAFEALSALVGLDSASRAFPLASGCERELHLAELYYDDVFDAGLRAETGQTLQGAREARKNGQDLACSLAAGHVRQAYFDKVHGEGLGPLQPPP